MNGVLEQPVSFQRFSSVTPPYDGSEMSSCNMDNDFGDIDGLFTELKDVKPTYASDEGEEEEEEDDDLLSVHDTHSHSSTESVQPSKKRKIQDNLTNDFLSVHDTHSHSSTESVQPPKKRKIQDNSTNLVQKKPKTTKSKEKELSPNHNALVARKNREKKKMYIQTLETKVQTQNIENEVLQSQVQTLQKTITELSKEVEYLRSVLLNQSDLANVLEAVASSSHIKLNHNISGTRKSIDHNYSKSNDCMSHNSTSPSTAQKPESGGICLHVSNGSVSFEMCYKCNENHKRSDEP
uniref:Uncharacterized protein LOC100177821 n=1 Tax=Phallusia mammillata TaxID=59560 RepID=A0A6F9DHE7_9ASCI|nr:uncharacterized protein LOC100177821 [Phallusia mammillata]